MRVEALVAAGFGFLVLWGLRGRFRFRGWFSGAAGDMPVVPFAHLTRISRVCEIVMICPVRFTVQAAHFCWFLVTIGAHVVVVVVLTAAGLFVFPPSTPSRGFDAFPTVLVRFLPVYRLVFVVLIRIGNDTATS